METKEYLERLNAIYYELNIGNARDYLDEIEALYLYKPVYVLWYFVKAKALALCGDAASAYTLIENKDTWFDMREVLFQFSELQMLLARICIDRKNYERNLYLSALQKRFWNVKCSDLEQLHYDQKHIGIVELLRFVYQNGFSVDRACLLKNMLYDSHEIVLQQLCNDVLLQDRTPGYGLEAWQRELPNMAYLREYCFSKKRRVFIILQDENELTNSSQVAAKACLAMGHNVIYIAKPVSMEVEHEIDLAQTVQVSIEQMKDTDIGAIIHPVELVVNGTVYGDNRDYLLDSLYHTCFEGEHVLVICSGILMDALSIQPMISKHFQRLTPRMAPFLESTLQYGWFGDYTSYISDIYQEDVKQLMHKKSECKFSIVIPARNSAYTLEHTLRTCIDQTYTGDYEIVVSDNSTDGNTEVYELCQSLGSDKIHYVKTPRNLHLPKSFEYAYLQAKGAYIFALGSDDGLLPWALQVLDEITEQYPEEEVIQWERGFYAWPGFNDGQQNMFVVPRDYEEGKYDLFFRDRADYIASILANPKNMYSLPMLYISSCFKRSYFDTLLEKTGRLWDGTCQDIYMGITTASINERILNMRYPLSIAGMSDSSIGANANRRKTLETLEQESKVNVLDGNVGAYCQSYYEHLISFTGTDTWSLYTSFLRMISIGVLPMEYMVALVDWKKCFLNLAREIDLRDVLFDRRMQDMRYAASLHGEEFFDWFEKEIYERTMRVKKLDENMSFHSLERSYKVGVNEAGGITLDASEYGVNNIAGSIKLMVEILTQKKGNE